MESYLPSLCTVGRLLGTEMISTTQAKLLRDSLTKILEDDGIERDDQEETGEQF